MTNFYLDKDTAEDTAEGLANDVHRTLTKYLSKADMSNPADLVAAIYDSFAGTLYEHKKTGGIYVVVGTCVIESTWKPGIVYTAVNHPGSFPIVRSAVEFFDGRFIPVDFDQS